MRCPKWVCLKGIAGEFSLFSLKTPPQKNGFTTHQVGETCVGEITSQPHGLRPRCQPFPGTTTGHRCFFGCSRKIDGDSWCSWWFNHLPGISIWVASFFQVFFKALLNPPNGFNGILSCPVVFLSSIVVFLGRMPCFPKSTNQKWMRMPFFPCGNPLGI